jgi:MerR family copper efflux transcriptional regulator
MGKLKIGELSKRADIATTTIRYYEQIGLLEDADRSENGYRLYDERTLDHLLFIKRGKQFGLSLEDIKELVKVRREGRCACSQMRQKIANKIQEIEEQIKEMEAFKQELKRYYNNAKDDPKMIIGKKPIPLLKVIQTYKERLSFSLSLFIFCTYL